MKNIYDRGHFQKYSIEDRYFSAVEGRSSLLLEGRETSKKPKVFLSHKHADLEDLKGLIGFLEKEYAVDVYIDSMDKDMPKKTNGKTAIRIKKVITSCDKFILLATERAIEAPWCNWELGFGDAHKYRDNIAILPVKEMGVSEKDYKGHEYMAIYPVITYYDGTEKYRDGTLIKQGYYYRYVDDNGVGHPLPLGDWLHQ